MLNIKTVTVIGANGTMGTNVSGIFASFGNAKVNMICRDIDKAIQASQKAAKSVKADSIITKLIPKTYSDLPRSIKESDLIFESVSEDIKLKKDINLQIGKYAKSSAIISTGSSGLSINELSQYLPKKIRPNFLGLHFYNPPYSMSLCEVIPSKITDQKLLLHINEYLKQTLFRHPVEVRDSPAFLGNRIGFQFINEALQNAEINKNKGGIDYIDSILGPFTGRSLPPLVTSDFVGLDIHKAIVDNVYINSNDYAHDTFLFPKFANNLINTGNIGKKSGCGLYQSIVDPNGNKTVNVYDIKTKKYRKKINYELRFANEIVNNLKVGKYIQAFKSLTTNPTYEANLCLTSLLKYVIYSLIISKEICKEISAADVAMATGFNWAPPISLINAFGGLNKFKSLSIDRLDKQFLNKIDMSSVLSNIPNSKFDYRPFFKAKFSNN